jgi:hypothetical protein
MRFSLGVLEENLGKNSLSTDNSPFAAVFKGSSRIFSLNENLTYDHVQIWQPLLHNCSRLRANISCIDMDIYLLSLLEWFAMLCGDYDNYWSKNQTESVFRRIWRVRSIADGAS